jgi:hypothetical protein
VLGVAGQCDMAVWQGTCGTVAGGNRPSPPFRQSSAGTQPSSRSAFAPEGTER